MKPTKEALMYLLREQAVVEKIIVGDKNLLVDKIYDFADAIALYGERADKLREKHGIVLTDETVTKKAKDIVTSPRSERKDTM